MNTVKVRVGRAVSGALSGKTIGRIFFNETVRTACGELRGRVLDLAGGVSPSYLPLLPKNIDLVRTNLTASPDVVAVDINQPLPFENASFDSVLLFNALYTVEDPVALAREVHRILKSGGQWHISSPFIANEMPEPHDYLRFTAEGLERLCKGAGFSDVQIVRMGERATSATQLMHPFFLFRLVRAVFFPLALLLDNLIPESTRSAHPTPLGYFVRCIK